MSRRPGTGVAADSAVRTLAFPGGPVSTDGMPESHPSGVTPSSKGPWLEGYSVARDLLRQLEHAIDHRMLDGTAPAVRAANRALVVLADEELRRGGS